MPIKVPSTTVQDDVITQLKAEAKDWRDAYEAMKIERNTLYRRNLEYKKILKANGLL